MTWNQERIDAVRNITGPPVTPAKADLLGALDEIERMHRARMGHAPSTQNIQRIWAAIKDRRMDYGPGGFGDQIVAETLILIANEAGE